MNVEREIKLRLAPGAAPGVWRLVRPARAPQRREVRSIYYDTMDQRLRRAGMALRLRREGKRWMQTLKAELAAHGALAERSEWEMPVRRAALDLSVFPRDEILAATRVDLKRLAGDLRPIFETRFVRRSAMVAIGGEASAELCTDQGRIAVNGREAPISELELELRTGDPVFLMRFLQRIAQPLGLELEVESKAERGYRLAAGQVIAPPRKWHKPRLQELSAPGEAFMALVSAALTQVAANAHGLRAGRDPEYLHQLRVGLRRLRSALRAFSLLVPRHAAKRVTRPLRELMPALGVARDWDVFCAWLTDAAATDNRSDAALALLVPIAARRRARARSAARRVARSRDFHAFLLSALAWLHEAPWAGRGSRAHTSLARFGSEALDRLHSKTVKGARHIDWRDTAQRHALRIRVKRLRYAAEFFGSCFPRASVRPFLARLEAMQDLLGELNDIAVAHSLLRVVAPPGGAARLRTAAIVARRRLAGRERTLIKALGPAWRELEKRRPFWHATTKAAARAAV